VATGEQATLYRARPVTQRQDAPADYLVKVARSDAPLHLATALLRREKVVAHSMSHPHLSAVVASGLRHAPPFLVLAGGAVAAMGTLSEAMPLHVPLWRARQTAAAMSALHTAGWIHSRLAPPALLFSQRGHLTLHEFGWARRIGTAECRGEHLLAADLRYVAPEMLCDATILTPACDVYCLGLLLIEMLIGRPAVDASVGWQAALVHLRGQFASVRELRPDLPGSLVRLIARMTAREPLRRPSAQEVERELIRGEIGCVAAGH
jgi:serine/threonine-protein kinase